MKDQDPGMLQFMGSQSVGHDFAAEHHQLQLCSGSPAHLLELPKQTKPSSVGEDVKYNYHIFLVWIPDGSATVESCDAFL